MTLLAACSRASMKAALTRSLTLISGQTAGCKLKASTSTRLRLRKTKEISLSLLSDKLTAKMLTLCTANSALTLPFMTMRDSSLRKLRMLRSWPKSSLQSKLSSVKDSLLPFCSTQTIGASVTLQWRTPPSRSSRINLAICRARLIEPWSSANLLL